jgi:hypothetical protein
MHGTSLFNSATLTLKLISNGEPSTLASRASNRPNQCPHTLLHPPPLPQPFLSRNGRELVALLWSMKSCAGVAPVDMGSHRVQRRSCSR